MHAQTQTFFDWFEAAPVGDGLINAGLAHLWLATRGGHAHERTATLVLNRVLDGMEGRLTKAKWAAISACSADTALRDINDLLARGVLRKLEGWGYGV